MGLDWNNRYGGVRESLGAGRILGVSLPRAWPWRACSLAGAAVIEWLAFRHRQCWLVIQVLKPASVVWWGWGAACITWQAVGWAAGTERKDVTVEATPSPASVLVLWLSDTALHNMYLSIYTTKSISSTLSNKDAKIQSFPRQRTLGPEVKTKS